MPGILKCLVAGLCLAALPGLSNAEATAQAGSAVPEKTAAQWRAAAEQDVAAAYDTYVANHPGMHDPANPDFPERLRRARVEGLRVAALATDRSGYMDALGAFSAELMDGHALAIAKQQPAQAASSQLEWPGFVAAWRGGTTYVHHAGPGSPAPAGSTIVECDGAPVRTLVQKRLGYRGFRPAEEGQWWFRTPRAFYSAPDFDRHRPRRCTFATADGRRVEAALAYEKAPDNFLTLVDRATDGERTPIGVSEPRQGLFLIGLQDFSPMRTA